MSATAKTREMSTVSRASLDQKLALSKRCSREATLAGAKAAAVATIASAIPTVASVRMLLWAKANINPTGQALIISTVAGMAYFIAADKKILSLARRHSFEEAPEHLRNTSFQGTGRLHPAFFRP
ncbi:early nodulin-93-like [Miscanthus floridulus]|uniref:early nodulin-93-like n=1 Tax=Miscanthus floridulus TaxID=154761 RepID=UPI00345768C8